MFRKLVLGAAALALAAAPAFAGPADDPANWRKVDPENLLVMTIKGQEVLVEMRPDFAPNHVERIRRIVREGNWDKVPFHRVIDDFMAQGGETYAIYQIYPRYGLLKQEFTFGRKPAAQPVRWVGKTAAGDQLGYLDGFLVQGQPDAVALISSPPVAKTWALHCQGVASMARTDDPNSAETQFFLMRHPRVGEDGLDAKYTVWGRALTGLDTIRAIKHGVEEENGVLSPGVADKLTKVVVAADMKAHLKPTVYVQRTDGPAFAAKLGPAAPVSPQDACDLPSPEVVVERPTP
jgi:peptidylprolyl isomerase